MSTADTVVCKRDVGHLDIGFGGTDECEPNLVNVARREAATRLSGVIIGKLRAVVDVNVPSGNADTPTITIEIIVIFILGLNGRVPAQRAIFDRKIDRLARVKGGALAVYPAAICRGVAADDAISHREGSEIIDSAAVPGRGPT